MDQPLAEPGIEAVSWTNVGVTLGTLKNAVEAKAPTPGSSTQKTEIIARKRALLLTERKRMNIYTDSYYAFSVVHAHEAIWKERHLHKCLELQKFQIPAIILWTLFSDGWRHILPRQKRPLKWLKLSLRKLSADLDYVTPFKMIMDLLLSLA